LLVVAARSGELPKLQGFAEHMREVVTARGGGLGLLMQLGRGRGGRGGGAQR
jgi:hypothetical protein